MAINRLYIRDERAIKALSNCGLVPIDDLKADGLRDKRIHDYIKEDLAKLEQAKINNEMVYALRLTEKGKELARTEYGIRDFQQPTSIKHDAKLSAIYHSFSFEERENWINETQLKRELIEEWGSYDNCSNHLCHNYDLESATISVADGYIDDTFIEIVTDNYGNQEIQEKSNYALAMGHDIQFY